MRARWFLFKKEFARKNSFSRSKHSPCNMKSRTGNYNTIPTNGNQTNVQIKMVESALRELDLEIRGALKVQAGSDSASESFKLVVESMAQLAKQKKELNQ